MSNATSLMVKMAKSTSAIDAIRQDLVRCGFELEFQALEGNESSEGVIDEDALSEAAEEAWDELGWTETFVLIQQHNRVACKFLELARDSWRSKSIDELITLFSGELRENIEDALQEARESFCTDWRDENESNYTSPADVYSELTVSRDTRDIIECGSDQSVNGGEIRTCGPLKPMQFLSAATDLLNNNDFTVDHGCSFHIHLSIPGVNHAYGAKFQAEMIAYILDNKTRLPADVRSRLTSDPLDKYAKLRISEDKFTAIHFHRGFHTWEFRLFGNVSDSSDARRCLIIAIEALRWAYRVKFNMEKSLVSQEIMAQFEDVAHIARESDSSYAKVRRAVSVNAYNAA